MRRQAPYTGFLQHKERVIGKVTVEHEIEQNQAKDDVQPVLLEEVDFSFQHQQGKQRRVGNEAQIGNVYTHKL